MQALRVRFSRRTAAEIAIRVGSGKLGEVRNAERWLAGRVEPRSAELIKLLQSDVGLDVLTALMGEAKPAWWLRFRRHLKIAGLRTAIAEQQRAIEQLEREAGQ